MFKLKSQNQAGFRDYTPSGVWAITRLLSSMLRSSETRTRNVNPPPALSAQPSKIERNLSFIESTAEVIDRETGVRELVELLENIIAEAGDLIEGRSPELVAQAYAVCGITATNRAGKPNDAQFRMSRRTSSS